jgi:hypothetical protein
MVQRLRRDATSGLPVRPGVRMTTILEIALAVGQATKTSRETIERLTRELAAKEAENIRLRHELGKARLLADLRRDIAERSMRISYARLNEFRRTPDLRRQL